METETKDIILKYIQSLKEPQSLTEVHQNLKKQFSYPTILKYCDLLIMEGKIKVKDYKNIKLVSPLK